jgi:hypothetical protein
MIKELWRDVEKDPPTLEDCPEYHKLRELGESFGPHFQIHVIFTYCRRIMYGIVSNITDDLSLKWAEYIPFEDRYFTSQYMPTHWIRIEKEDLPVFNGKMPKTQKNFYD